MMLARSFVGGGLSSASARTFQYNTRRFKASRATTPTTTTTTTTATSTAATVTRSQPLVSRIWNSYTTALEKSPLTTKMMAAAFIFFTSDTATQRIMDPEASWDGARATSGAVFGVVATGYLHFWWGFLERTIGAVIPAARHRVINTAAKVIIDQGAGAPLYIYTYYIITNTIQKLSSSSSWSKQAVTDIVQEQESRARHMLWPTMLQHWKVWPAVHSLNFYFVPLQHRVLLQNTVLVGWSGYLSHLNKTGLPEEDGKLMTPKEEIESTIKSRKTLVAPVAVPSAATKG